MHTAIGRVALVGALATLLVYPALGDAQVAEPVAPPSDAPPVPTPDGAAEEPPTPEAVTVAGDGSEPGAAPAEAEEAAGAGMAPVAGRSGVTGRVLDAATGEGMIEASVQVLGRPQRVITDLDGNFSIALPPGTYSLRSFYELYQPTRLDRVVVPAGGHVEVTIELQPDQESVQEVVVTARADTATAATQLQIRRQSAVVQDSISAEEMARTPDSTASDAVRRVVAASVVDGRYLFVRGLGGRYTNVLLNGVPLPSADPDMPGVQLDLFPSTLLNSLSVAKTFTPDLPGDFAGGTMQIATRDFPAEFRLSTTITLGANSETTFRDVPGYEGGSTDFLGFDDGTRALPASVPTERLEITRSGLNAADIERIAGSFQNRWETTGKLALPQLNLSVNLGDTVKAFGRDLGYVLAVGYQHTPRRRPGRVATTRLVGEGATQDLDIDQSLEVEAAQTDVLWGAVGSSTLSISDDHEISLLTMYNQSSTDLTQEVQGYTEREGTNMRSSTLNFVQRSLFFGQLLGSHRELPLPKGARLDWQLHMGAANRYEPDRRDVLYLEGQQGYFWRSLPGSGERLFADLDQLDLGGGADLTIPLGEQPKLRVGTLLRRSDRSFSARRFRYDFTGTSAEQRLLPPERLFGSEGLATVTEMVEVTRPDDGYESTQELYSAYALVDTPLVGSLRLVTGVRAEGFVQDVVSSSPFGGGTVDPSAQVRRTDVDALPAASLVLELSDAMYVRAGYGGTVARPQIRELAPFLFQDFVRRRTVTGNPGLARTFIHNLDLRWEFFPGAEEVVAASVFYKRFEDPIEQVVADRQGNITYDNAEQAENLGLELESRLSLGRLADVLTPLSVGANLTVVESEIRLNESQRMSATNAQRPLAGQSPYVANVSLGFSLPDTGLTAFVYYNVFGRRIAEVGRLGLPDVYEEPFQSLDVTVGWEAPNGISLRLGARNLLLASNVLKQGIHEVSRFEPGMTASLRVGYTH